MNERRKDGLLDFSIPQLGVLLLHLPRLAELHAKNRRPVSCDAIDLGLACDRGQLAGPLTDPVHTGRRKKNAWPNQRTLVPPLGVSQGERENSQHTACPLELVEARPLGVENLGQVRMERIAREEPRLRSFLPLLRVFVEVNDPLEGCEHVLTE